MLFSELLEDLQNLTKQKITQQQIADVLQISQGAIAKRIARNSDFNREEVALIKNAFGVDDVEETLLMDYYPEVFGSCGSGVFELSQVKEQIKIPKKALFTYISPIKKYSVINAYGNSMQPYILDKDRLIVEHYEGGQIIDNRVYVFAYGNEIFVKRLVKNINQLVIMSDNKDYDVIKLSEKEIDNVHIIGQIVGIMRDVR